MPATALYLQANRHEVLSTGHSSTGVLVRSLSIREQYSASDRSFRQQCNARNGLYSVGKSVWILVGSYIYRHGVLSVQIGGILA